MTLDLNETRKRANRTLIGAILMISVDIGTYVTLSNYISPLCEKLQASPTQIVLMFSIASIATIISKLLTSAIIEKVPVKLLAIIGSVGYLLFFLCMRFSNSLFMLYAGALGFGIAITFAGFTVMQPVVTWWHTENLGKKIGYLSMGYAASGILLGIVIAKMIASLGFKTTSLLHGLVGSTILLFSAIFLISNKPSTYGLEPYGQSAAAGIGASAAVNHEPAGMTLKESLKTLPLWGITITLILTNAISTGFSNNASLIYQSYGLDLVKAGTMISIFHIIAIAWNYAYGAMSDKLTPRRTNIIFSVLGAFIMLISAFLSGMPGAIFIAIMYGFMNYTGMIAAVSLPGIFGKKAIGSINAFVLALSSLGSMIGAPIASSLYEKSGNYVAYQKFGFVVMIVVSVLLIISTSKKAVPKQDKE